MNAHDKKVICKMIEHADHILAYIAPFDSLAAFSENTMSVDACVFNLMQIGELAHAQLSGEAKAACGNIPWEKIYGMRNRIVHGYENINMAVVWETAKNDIEKMRDALQELT